MTAQHSGPGKGFISRRSEHPFEEAVSRLKAVLAAKSVTLFAEVDHSGEAARAGLTMPPTRLLIFGNPKAGTPVMLAAPSSAIDLPLKLLVWEDVEGAVWISWNDPAWLAARHNIPGDLLKNIAVAEGLAAQG